MAGFVPRNESYTINVATKTLHKQKADYVVSYSKIIAIDV